jgi:hypothetical protein
MSRSHLRIVLVVAALLGGGVGCETTDASDLAALDFDEIMALGHASIPEPEFAPFVDVKLSELDEDTCEGGFVWMARTSDGTIIAFEEGGTTTTTDCGYRDFTCKVGSAMAAQMVAAGVVEESNVVLFGLVDGPAVEERACP